MRNGDVDELAEAILGLIGNPKRREELGIAAVRRSAEFNKGSHNRAWDRLIESGCVERQRINKRSYPPQIDWLEKACVSCWGRLDANSAVLLDSRGFSPW